MSKSRGPHAQERIYFVRGAHCPSCELLIERKVSQLPGVRTVHVSARSGRVVVHYAGSAPAVAALNKLLSNDGYLFGDEPFASQDGFRPAALLPALLVAGVLIAAFLLLEKMGLSGLVNVNATSSLPALFAFGVLAGLSSCAALVGGMVLSLSRQWLEAYPSDASFARKAEPHLLFNAGRLLSYALLGALLGSLGGLFQLSQALSAIVVVVVALLMLVLGLQMLGIPPFNRFQLALPKFITRRISNEQRFAGRTMPFILGALTFFLPCGFTLTAQSLALLSGNPWRGGLIMLTFALGTLPMLLTIGLSSMRLLQTRSVAPLFSRVAGALVLFFALWTIQARLNVMGLAIPVSAGASTSVAAAPVAQATPSAPAKQPTATSTGVQAAGDAALQKGLPPIVDGKQVVKTVASASGYEPRTFKIRVGIPVRWEITDQGTSGCTNAVIAPSMFQGRIPLRYGETSTKEFTPLKVGTFRYSCWMGMVTGRIQVVQ